MIRLTQREKKPLSYQALDTKYGSVLMFDKASI